MTIATIEIATFTTKSKTQFTVAELARHMKIDEKKARARLRANASADSPLNEPKRVASDAKNTKHIWTKNKTNVNAIATIIAAPSMLDAPAAAAAE